MIELETARARLRGWRPEDLDAFAEMNADPEVMKHFPAPYSREQSDALAVKSQQRLESDGLGVFALEIKEDRRFAGFVGLSRVTFEAPFRPAVEIGWRLPTWAWGRGYASEAARRCLDYGFRDKHLAEIVSFTAVANLRSQALMARIGMTHDPAQDFPHPWLAAGHPLQAHVFYRMTQEEFLEQAR